MIADLGCGRGELGRLLLGVGSDAPGHVASRVDGFDADPDQIEAARGRARAEGLTGKLRFEEADVRSIPRSDATYDAVVCQALLTHVSRPEEVVSEMVRLVRPGGLVAVIEPDLPGAIQATDDRHQSDLLRAGLLRRLETATQGAARRGLGSWDAAATADTLLESAGLVETHTRTEEGLLRLTPPYSPSEEQVRAALLSWTDLDALAAEAAMQRWLSADAFPNGELTVLEEAERRAAESRTEELRRGQWHGTVACPLVVTVGRRPHSSV
ncbi:MAG: class I SAM-dependent methyltransferase [Deltaproteobacteria bacterium]|nr:class I SAM-dependent methyltransferase [Deltaproteobacteria bacterium]